MERCYNPQPNPTPFELFNIAPENDVPPEGTSSGSRLVQLTGSTWFAGTTETAIITAIQIEPLHWLVNGGSGNPVGGVMGLCNSDKSKTYLTVAVNAAPPPTPIYVLPTKGIWPRSESPNIYAFFDWITDGAVYQPGPIRFRVFGDKVLYPLDPSYAAVMLGTPGVQGP
jgi:hypothetical protein